MDKITGWWDYVLQVAPGEGQAEIARRVGVDRSAITRWRNGAGADARFAIKFARAYGRPPVEALVAAGLLEPEEADVTTVRAHAGDLSNRELIAELDRRLEAGTNVVRPEFGQRSRPFALDAVAHHTEVSIYDEAAATEEQP